MEANAQCDWPSHTWQIAHLILHCQSQRDRCSIMRVLTFAVTVFRPSTPYLKLRRLDLALGLLAHPLFTSSSQDKICFFDLFVLAICMQCMQRRGTHRGNQSDHSWKIILCSRWKIFDCMHCGILSALKWRWGRGRSCEGRMMLTSKILSVGTSGRSAHQVNHYLFSLTFGGFLLQLFKKRGRCGHGHLAERPVRWRGVWTRKVGKS